MWQTIVLVIYLYTARYGGGKLFDWVYFSLIGWATS